MKKDIDLQKIATAIGEFHKKNILVVGDVMLDRFVWGGVSRISPEAPVPVVKVNRETIHLGGSGNVVNNLVALGAKCILVGAIGSDTAGMTVFSELNKQGVETSSLVKTPRIQTIQKIRILAASQQIVRVDREDAAMLDSKIEKSLCGVIKKNISKADAVIISDYGKGVVSRPVIKTVLNESRKKGVPVMVDPKIEHFFYYKNTTCITPNIKEAMEGMFFRKTSGEKDLSELGRSILRKLKTRSVLITRGEHGMSLFEQSGRISHIPTVAREVYDVTGAGDTVISVFTLGHVSGLSLFESAYLSNIAGGIVVGKVGTATTSPKELIDWIEKI